MKKDIRFRNKIHACVFFPPDKVIKAELVNG